MSKNILRSVQTISMDDLEVNFDYGWAFQKDFNNYDYGENYWKNYINLEETETAKKLNDFRKAISTKYANRILDVGIGSGAYLKTLSCDKYGYDVNPYANAWLKEQKIWHDPYKENNANINGFCFWDVLEHIENPNILLDRINLGTHIFVSLPVFSNLEMIHLSKHYKPNEHLQYFTTRGVINFLNLSGFFVKEIRSDESKIGRENVMTFVAQKR